jgi:hypothetical protein
MEYRSSSPAALLSVASLTVLRLLAVSLTIAHLRLLTITSHLRLLSVAHLRLTVSSHLWLLSVTHLWLLSVAAHLRLSVSAHLWLLSIALPVASHLLLTILWLLSVASHLRLSVSLPDSLLTLSSLHIVLVLEKFFEGQEELWFLSHAVAVLVYGSHGLHGLLAVDAGGVTGHGEDIIEEHGEFVAVQSARLVAVVLHEYLVDIGLQLFVRDAHICSQIK